MKRPGRLRAIAGAVLALLTAMPVAAQDLPPAREVLDRYVEAIGGREAVLASFASRTVGDFEIVGAGISSAFEVIVDQPGLMVTNIDISGFGASRSGFDGTVAWSIDPFQGPMILAGDQLAEVRGQTDPLFAVRDASLFDSVETVSRMEMNSVPCFRVRLAWKSGLQSFDCYAVETGLLVATVSAGGASTTLSDYREAGGILSPMRMEVDAMGMRQVVSISSVTFGDIDPGAFELPTEIRALAGTR